MQGCALAELGGPWRLTFAFGRLENLRFFIQIICWHPRFYSFRALGSLQFSFEHSLDGVMKQSLDEVFEKSRINKVKESDLLEADNT